MIGHPRQGSRAEGNESDTLLHPSHTSCFLCFRHVWSSASILAVVHFCRSRSFCPFRFVPAPPVPSAVLFIFSCLLLNLSCLLLLSASCPPNERNKTKSRGPRSFPSRFRAATVRVAGPRGRRPRGDAAAGAREAEHAQVFPPSTGQDRRRLVF